MLYKTIMPKVKIEGGIQDLQKKERNVRPKHSNFLLTINTNKGIADGSEGMAEKIATFETSINQILQNVGDYVRLPDGDDWNDDEKFKDVNIQYTIERGDKQHRLHIHILFQFTHFSKILLNYDKIKSKICDDMGLENVYMLNKLIKNSGQMNITDYLQKYT